MEQKPRENNPVRLLILDESAEDYQKALAEEFPDLLFRFRWSR